MGKKILLSSRVDEQVLFTFLGVGLLAIVILGFRYTTRPSCVPISIQIGSDTIQGHVVRFNAQAEGGKSFSWDFDDNENPNANTDQETASATHIFNSPGKYTVSVLVNGTCTASRDIFVRQPEPGSTANLQPKIIALDSVILGEKVQFNDANSSSLSWDWNFGEPGAAGSHLRSPVFVFTTTGPKKVVVYVNGKADLADTKFVYVAEKEKKIDIAKPKQDVVRRPQNPDIPKEPVTQPLPQPQQDVPVKKEPDPPPPVVKIPDPPAHYIETILKGVPEGGDWKEPLSKYLCGGDVNLPVWYNNKQTTLSQFCEELKKMKTKKIKQITVVPSFSKQTNCITELKITIDKKNFFQRVL